MSTEKVDWDREKVLKLINLYELHPELWDASNKCYHMRNKKFDAWQEISAGIVCDAETAKTKMDSLLSSLRREKAKIKGSMRTGKGRSEIYRSKWFAFPAFMFLLNKDKPRTTVNTADDWDSDYYNNQTTDFEDNDLDFDTLLGDTSETQTVECEYQEASTEEMTPKRKKKIFLSPKKKKKNTDDEDPRVSAAFEILKNVSSTTPKDECSTFGDHIATKLGKLTDPVRSVAMHLINNVIFEAETGKLNNYNSSEPETRPKITITPSYLNAKQTLNKPGQQFVIISPSQMTQQKLTPMPILTPNFNIKQ